MDTSRKKPNHLRVVEDSCPSNPNPANLRSLKSHPAKAKFTREESGRLRRQVRPISCSCCSSSTLKQSHSGQQKKKESGSSSISAPKSPQKTKKSFENSKWKKESSYVQASDPGRPNDNTLGSSKSRTVKYSCDKRGKRRLGIFCPRCSKFFTSKRNLSLHEQNNWCKSSTTTCSCFIEFHCDNCSSIFKLKGSLRRHQRVSFSNSVQKITVQVQVRTTEDNSQTPFQNSQLFPKQVKATPNPPQAIQFDLTIISEIQPGFRVVKQGGQDGDGQDGVNKVVRFQRTRFVCRNCSFTTLNAYAMRRHYRLHTAQIPFKCPNLRCDYTARWIENLRRHQPVPYKIGSTDNKETEDNLGPDSNIQVDGDDSSNWAYACMLCNFIGESALSALKHSGQHKTAVISLNRI